MKHKLVSRTFDGTPEQRERWLKSFSYKWREVTTMVNGELLVQRVRVKVYPTWAKLLESKTKGSVE